MDELEEFEQHRSHLFGVAYRMLGSVAEAEDAVQESWLRWQECDRSTVRVPRAWLTTVVTRLSIDRLRSAQARRESYVGPWLPDPLVTPADDPADTVEMADALSMAFLVLLERLDPVERAAFLLREVFGHTYAEIAGVVDRSEVACRQIVHRARERLDPDRAPRFEPDPIAQRRMLEEFLAAVVDGDLERLESHLAEDVVALSDGGADRHAARRPVVGRHRVAIFVRNLAARVAPRGQIEVVRVNGNPGLAIAFRDRLDMVVEFELSPDGVRSIRSVLNPDKLAHLDRRFHRS